MLRHGARLIVVSNKIPRISHAISEMVVMVLNSISRFSTTTVVSQEMVHIRMVVKLYLVLQVECEAKKKEMAWEILKSHARNNIISYNFFLITYAIADVDYPTSHVSI